MWMTTLKKIRAHSPPNWDNLLQRLGKTEGDDQPLPIIKILDSCGFNDAIWCLRAVDDHYTEIRRYVLWCVCRVEIFMKDPRSTHALHVSERYINGLDTVENLIYARGHALAAAKAADALDDSDYAAADAAWAAVDAARAASGCVDAVVSATARAADAARAYDTDERAAWETERRAQETKLREVAK